MRYLDLKNELKLTTTLITITRWVHTNILGRPWVFEELKSTRVHVWLLMLINVHVLIENRSILQVTEPLVNSPGFATLTNSFTVNYCQRNKKPGCSWISQHWPGHVNFFSVNILESTLMTTSSHPQKVGLILNAMTDSEVRKIFLCHSIESQMPRKQVVQKWSLDCTSLVSSDTFKK